MATERQEGIFGECRAYTDVNENQGRGTLHLHGSFWSDLRPELLQQALTSPEALKALCQRLDSIVQCSLPSQEIQVPKDGMEISLTMSPSPSKTEEFTRRWTQVASRLNVHQHAPTCHKGKVGALRCRMGYPQACVNHPTDLRELVVTHVDGGKVVEAQPLENKTQQVLIGADALLKREPRILVLEHHRPESVGRGEKEKESGEESGKEINAWVVNFNRFLTAAAGCNTAVYFLGIQEQAKGAMYYMADYLVKSPTDLAAMLSLALSAQQKAIAYPSTAEDADAPERKTKLFLARLLNGLHSMQEVPAQMAAAALLGLPGEIVSHMTDFIWIDAAVQFRIHEGEGRSCDINLAEESEDMEIEGGEEGASNDETDSKKGGFDDESIFDEEESQCDLQPTVPVITVEGRKVPTSTQHENYMLRGKELEPYSLYFYVALIKVVPRREGKEKGKEKEKEKEKDQETGNDTHTGAGRKRNATFSFDSRHPLHSALTQQLRSKQVVPTFAGYHLPKHPGERKGKDWKDYNHQANRFAAYILTLFKPWTVDSCETLDWLALDSWTQFLQREDATYVERCTLWLMGNFTNNFSTSSYTRWITSTWRNRMATRWSQEEIAQALREECMLKESEEVAMQAYLDYLQVAADQNEEGGDCAQENYNHRLLEELAAIWNDGPGITPAAKSGIVHYDDIERVGHVVEALRLVQEDDKEEKEDGGLQDFLHVDLDPDPCLNAEQNEVLMKVLPWLASGAAASSSSLRILIHGGPGTGKSFFATTLIRRAKQLPNSRRILCCAPTGIASTLLPKGQTIHSLLKLPIDKKGRTKMSAQTLQAARRRLAGVRLLIIDEVSMVDCSLLERTDRMLQQLLEDKSPFGGLGVILMGDFFQLPCIGRPLFSASSSTRAGQLFREFQVFHFTQQMRAASDQEHANMLESLRQTDSPSMTAEHLAQLQVLSLDAMRSDPSWRFAPIVVTNNRERHALNITQLKAFACRQGVPLVRWKNVLHSQAALWFSEKEDKERLYSMLPELWGWFVPGAPVFLTENLCPEKGLANGTRATMSSLTLADAPRFWELYQRTPPGELLELEAPPLAVNVQVLGWEKMKEDEVLYSEGCENHVVIPLKAHGWSECKMKTRKDVKAVKGRQRGVLKFQEFPYELGFSVTFHKVQGQTMRVILDLNHTPAKSIDRASLLVGLSRAKNRKDVMILPLITSTKHLMELKWDKKLIQWWQNNKSKEIN